MGLGPLVIGGIFLFNSYETIGALIMSASLVTIPRAVKAEEKLLRSKCVDIDAGSPAGNIIAIILGIIVVGGAIWMFYTLAYNLYTGDY